MNSNRKHFHLNPPLFGPSQGGSVPGDGTEEVISAVNLGHTPASWRALCKHPTPGTLHAFLQDFHARVDFFQVMLLLLGLLLISLVTLLMGCCCFFIEIEFMRAAISVTV